MTSSGDGGGIWVERDDDNDGGFTLTDSLIVENEAAKAGGIYAGPMVNAGDVDLAIERTTIAGNEAVSGAGGIYLDGPRTGSATISESTISGNATGEEGGGVYVSDPGVPLTIESSTISGNSAEQGGGVYVQNGRDVEISLANSTVTANAAVDAGGGIYRLAADDATAGPDTVTLSSTIVANNTAPEGPDLSEEPTDVFGSFALDFSLVEDPSAATVTESQAGTNILGVDPQLGPLAANGGPTLTHQPAPTSPALDAGTANGFAADQRGLARTVDQASLPNQPGSDGTDIGAVELALVPEPGPPERGRCRGKQVAKLEGTDGDDRIRGTGDPDLIVGLAGNDVLEGLGAADCIRGDEGRDTLKGGGGGDRLAGGDGNDRLRGQGASDRLAGQAGNDNLNGGGGRDRLIGGPGKDKLKGGPGKDKLKGGPGKDKLIAASSERDKVNCGGGRDKVRADAEDKVSRNCEKVVVVDD